MARPRFVDGRIRAAGLQTTARAGDNGGIHARIRFACGSGWRRPRCRPSASPLPPSALTFGASGQCRRRRTPSMRGRRWAGATGADAWPATPPGPASPTGFGRPIHTSATTSCRAATTTSRWCGRAPGAIGPGNRCRAATAIRVTAIKRRRAGDRYQGAQNERCGGCRLARVTAAMNCWRPSGSGSPRGSKTWRARKNPVSAKPASSARRSARQAPLWAPRRSGMREAPAAGRARARRRCATPRVLTSARRRRDRRHSR